MKFTKEDRREMGRKAASLHKQGLTWEILAKRFGVSKRQLQEYAKEANGEL